MKSMSFGLTSHVDLSSEEPGSELLVRELHSRRAVQWHRINTQKLEHGWRMIYAAVPSFCGFGVGGRSC